MWPDFILDLADHLRADRVPIFIVGGAVRDAALGRTIKDVDLITPLESISLAKHITNVFGGDVFVLDAERGVARAMITTAEGRKTLDIARFRGDDLAADLVDRDFTINAMAVDLKGDLDLLIDPLGGEEDVNNKLLRRCSPHAITDDPIRALRAVRQCVQFSLRIEPETLQDIRRVGAKLLTTSPERIRDEVVNLLLTPKCASALRIAAALGLLGVIFPETEALKTQTITGGEAHTLKNAWEHTLAVVEHLERIFSVISPTRTDETAASFDLGMMAMQLDRFRSQLQAHLETTWANGRAHRALLMLAALLHQTMDGNISKRENSAVERAEALRLSNAEKARLVAMISHHELLAALPDLSKRSIYRFWRQTDIAGVDICLLGMATHLAQEGIALNQDRWLMLIERVRMLLLAYYEQYEQVVAPIPLLDGNQLMQRLGIKPGPTIGKLLERLIEAQAVGDVQTVEAAEAFLRAEYNAET